MSYAVSKRDLSKVKLNESDTVASTLQNVAVLLSTWQGSVPLYREFGLPTQFIDKPIPVAKPMLHAAIKEAVEAYEPRAEVMAVTFQEDPAVPGRLIPIVEVSIAHE